MSQQQPPPYAYPQQQYPPGGPQYPPQPQQYPGYPPQQPGYPPQQQPGYPGGFAPQAPAYQPPYPQQQQSSPNYSTFSHSGPSQPQGGYGAFQGQQAMAGAFRQQNMGGYDSDAEGGRGADNTGAGGMGSTFGDKAIRRAFIRKVYGILSIQMVVTCAIIAPFLFHQPLRTYARQNQWMYWTAFGVTFACMIAMVCCESVRRKAPTNFIFLGIFTVCEGFMLGSISAAFDAEAVLIAAGITAGVTLGLTLFAFQSKWDFTACGGMLCGMLVILMIAGLLMAFLPLNKYAMIGYGCAGALIFSMYIVYDTQLMMGGSHKYSISPEEYIFAALNIYLDIINLFLYILMIVGASRSD